MDTVINCFVEKSKEILQDNLVGVYLHGSAVMGCYNPSKSDIDLIVVVKEHGIALFQVYDKNCIPVSHSCGPDAEEFADDPTKYIEDHWPEYCVKCFETDSDVPITIYPTKDMINEIYRIKYDSFKRCYFYRCARSGSFAFLLF